MEGNIFAALAAAFICTTLVWLLRHLMLRPVRSGKNTVQTLVLRVYGSEPQLEDNIRGLIWLNNNGLIHCRIVILGYELDAETRFIAKAFQNDYRGITLIEDGEIGQWIRNWNCWNYPVQ